MHNAPYTRKNNLSDMLNSIIQVPEDGESGEWHSIDHIIQILSMKYNYFVVSNTTNRDIGRILTALGLERKRANTGYIYKYILK